MRCNHDPKLKALCVSGFCDHIAQPFARAARGEWIGISPGRDRGIASFHTQGFTIIEMLVVVAVLALLLALNSVLVCATWKAR
jgi:prepilin-type N-terminal cleavage/methylation domain-containing protein